MAEIDCATSFTKKRRKKISRQPTLWVSHGKIIVFSENNTSVCGCVCSRLVCISQQSFNCVVTFYGEGLTV